MKTVLPFSEQQVRSWKETYPTPFHLYDEQGITDTVRGLQDAFSWNKGFKEYFAVKATPTPAIIRLLRDLGCGCDCASRTEVMMAERCGISGSGIMFSSNETSDAEYRKAAEAGAIINFDDVTQIENFEQALGRIPERVCCRYNPGRFGITNDIMGHLYDSKFGMPEDQLFRALKTLKEKGAKHFGVHAMLASCSLEEEYYPNLARELFRLALKIRKELDIELEFVDMAGGMGIPYRPEEKPVNIKSVGEGVRRVYEEILLPAGMELSIFTEMGRYITGPNGYLITTVIGKKHIYKEYIGVDATACDLMRPAIYGAYHHITVLGKENAPIAFKADVVGSLCENNDKFAVDRELPAVEYGDVLAIQDTGAHGRSMGYNYNGKLRSAELMLKPDGSVKLIRRAETPEDYFATLDVDREFRI